MGRIAGMVTSFVSQDSSISLGMSLYMVGGIISMVLIVLLEQDTTGMDLATEIDKTGTDRQLVEMEYVSMEYQTVNEIDKDNHTDEHNDQSGIWQIYT